MTPVPNFNKWCAVSNFLFKNIDFCIFTPKTPLVKENYFLTLWNFTYLKDTSFGKKSCNFEHGLETKNEFEKWPLITFFQCTYVGILNLIASIPEPSILKLSYLKIRKSNCKLYTRRISDFNFKLMLTGIL